MKVFLDIAVRFFLGKGKDIFLTKKHFSIRKASCFLWYYKLTLWLIRLPAVSCLRDVFEAGAFLWGE
jgi:hypothetical protein